MKYRKKEFKELEGKFSSLRHAVLDTNRNRLFFNDMETTSIYMIENFYTNAHEVKINLLYRGTSSDGSSLAFDWISNNIYWTEMAYRLVMIMSVSSRKSHALSVQELELPTGIAVDPIHRYVRDNKRSKIIFFRLSTKYLRYHEKSK